MSEEQKKLTQRTKEVLVELLQDTSKYISHSATNQYRRSAEVTDSGSWIMRTTHFGSEKVLKIHGRIVNTLIDRDLIEIDTTKDHVDKFIFYKLSKTALLNVRAVRQFVMFDTKAVLKRDLNALAAMFGLVVNYCASRGYFEIKPLDQTITGYVPVLVSTTPAGEPIYKFSDLTWQEWEYHLNEVSKIYGTVK